MMDKQMNEKLSFVNIDDYYRQVGIEIGYMSVSAREFIAKMLTCNASRKDIETWFLAKQEEREWLVAQGVLAACYGMDPP